MDKESKMTLRKFTFQALCCTMLGRTANVLQTIHNACPHRQR